MKNPPGNTPGNTDQPTNKPKPTDEQPSTAVQGCPSIEAFREDDVLPRLVVPRPSTPRSRTPTRANVKGGSKGGRKTLTISAGHYESTTPKKRKPKNARKRVMLKNYLPK
jgi:hypothetical protein